MSANTNATAVIGEAGWLAQLSDADLLAQTRSLVGRTIRLLADLLAHLGEVEARGVHRTRACSSLYTYCIYELRFSEDEAFRRVAAARLVRRFPALLDAVAAGELHLTGLLMVGPHLTEANCAEVLARAKYRTKREIARLVRELDPLPPVPARIEPLGPAPARLVPAEPTWEQFVGAMNPVRDLEPGERPREWGVGDDERARDSRLRRRDAEIHSHGWDEAVEVTETDRTTPAELEVHASARVKATPTGADSRDIEEPEMHAPARAHGQASDDLAAPHRYKVQFTASEEYVRLVDEAKALLSHAAPRASLEEVQLRAMRSFVEALRKRKYAAKVPVGDGAGPVPSRIAEGGSDATRTRDESPLCTRDESFTPRANELPQSEPRRRGRYIPAAIRRAVALRDGCRCTYADAFGRRCSETRRLEFHHVVPFAFSPSHDVANITLRCAAHNTLAAEQDFGRDLVEARRSAARHARFGEQSR